VLYKEGTAEFEGAFLKAQTAKNQKAKGTVVIIHDWDGLTDYEIKRAELLTQQGFNVFALDMFGKGNRPVEQEKKKAETAKLYDDRPRMRRILNAGLETAARLAPGKTFLLGYCFGGAVALEHARAPQSPDIRGIASFHGGLKTPPGQAYTTSAPLFIAHGGADTAVPLEDVTNLATELEKVKIVYDIEIYSGAPHAFSVFGSPAYRESADKKSWLAFTNFIESQSAKP